MNEVLTQLEDNWGKIVAFLLYKLHRTGTVSVTVEDIEAFAASGLVLYTHGHKDSFEFRLVTPETAKQLKEHHEKTHKGRA